ncbi:hypothetical protein INT48_009778 [Thamnidium elegans]|uniref:Zn(2)-C6 fungal-type domain-containing protein n=1 Tax=Thamnidium elegans TaxID=101142 RepID=A0A8H7VZ71_9FUNG|nr:hypothetical protein INT48_009778 [Thamnidium elegans]
MNTAKLVDGDKTRRKRLKVVSACGECRRKKTKCNGEKPCAGCLKAHVELHAPHTQNRRLPREKRKRHEQDEKDEKDEQGVTETKRLIRDDFGHGYQYNNKLQLAPIKIINNQQHSPGTPTIKNLLNEDDTTRWYPQTKSSAFFRMSSPRLPNEIINTNSATTAAGSSS